MADDRSTANVPSTLDGPWTHFWDMHSGGGQKLPWAHIFIQADEDTARKMFAEAFGRDPDNETCSCCGDDYVIEENPSLSEATGYHRNLRYVSPLSEGGWASATLEERREANRVGHYIEPGEPVPDGWHVHDRFRRGDEVSMDEFLADPHFYDLGRRREVKILARPNSGSTGAPRPDGGP